MARRKAKASSRLALPWERGDSVLYAIVSGRRLWPLFAVFFVASVIGLAYWIGDRRAEMSTTRATLAEVTRATHAFVRGIGRCPHSAEELVHPPKSGMRYLAMAPIDAWGHSIRIRCTLGEHAEVEAISAGPSGSFLDDDNVM